MLQMQLFEEVENPKKKGDAYMNGNTDHSKKVTGDNFCSHNLIKEKGLYYLRTCINRAKAKKNYREFLFFLKQEIDFKKGKTTLSNAVRTSHLTFF